MPFEDVKLVAYVSRCRWGRSSLSTFVPFARKLAAKEELTGALLNAGGAFFHVVEGSGHSVDRFMAHVVRTRSLCDTHVVFEACRPARMFERFPLVYCFDESWRDRIAHLMAGEPLPRSDLWHFCLGLRERTRQMTEE